METAAGTPCGGRDMSIYKNGNLVKSVCIYHGKENAIIARTCEICGKPHEDLSRSICGSCAKKLLNLIHEGEENENR